MQVVIVKMTKKLFSRSCALLALAYLIFLVRCFRRRSARKHHLTLMLAAVRRSHFCTAAGTSSADPRSPFTPLPSRDARYQNMPDNNIPSQKCRDTNMPRYLVTTLTVDNFSTIVRTRTSGNRKALQLEGRQTSRQSFWSLITRLIEH